MVNQEIFEYLIDRASKSDAVNWALAYHNGRIGEPEAADSKIKFIVWAGNKNRVCEDLVVTQR